MKSTRFGLSSLVASTLVFGSLGVSGFVGSVATFADDRGAPVRKAPKAVNLDNAIDTATIVRTSAAKVSRLAKSQLLGAHLSKDGMLTGRLNISDSVSGAHVAAENLQVKFVQRGSIISDAKPGPGGVFQVAGLTPGVYSMIASGADGFFISTVVVYAYEVNADVEAGSAIVDPLQIDATVVHPSNAGVIAKLIQRSTNPRLTKPISSASRKQVVQASREENADETPAPLQTPVLKVGNDGRVVIAIDEVNPATGERTPAKGATAYLVQRGAVRGQFQVDQDGSFNAKDITPGQYSFLILTNSATPWISAMGVIVEKDNGNTGTVSTSGRLNVQQVKGTKLQGAAPTFTPAPGGDTSGTADPGTGTGNNDDRLAGGAFMGGGGGGGGFGGGGFGGGFGGLAGLAGIGGLAAGLVALGQNNDNNNTPASPLTP